MRGNISVAILLLTSSLISAQPEMEWEQRFAITGFPDCRGIAQKEDSGFILGGTSGSRNFFIMEIDANGDSIRAEHILNNEYQDALAFIKTRDEGYALAGYEFHSNPDFRVRDDDVLVMKFDWRGEEEWSLIYRSNQIQHCHSILETEAGGFILAGWAGYHEWHMSLEWIGDFYMMKTDDNGEIEWSHVYELSDYDNQCMVVKSTFDGGYILAGYKELVRYGNRVAQVVRTDSDGEEIWSNTYSALADNSINDVVALENGNFALVGSTTFGRNRDSEMWLLVIDEDGDSLSSHTFGGEDADVAYTIKVASDGGYVIVGYTNSFGAGGSDVWLLRTDAGGDSLWSCTFGGIADDYGNSLVITDIGGYVIAGTTNNEDDYDEYYVVSTNPDPLSMKRIANFLNPSAFFLSSYPNPFNSSTTIEYYVGSNSNSIVRLGVYDNLGRLVKELANGRFEAGQHRTIWEAGELPSGSYNLNAVIDGKLFVRRISLIK